MPFIENFCHLSKLLIFSTKNEEKNLKLEFSFKFIEELLKAYESQLKNSNVSKYFIKLLVSILDVNLYNHEN